MLQDLVRRSRSYRRFVQSCSVEMSTLRSLIELATQVPSGANKQPLKYYLSNTAETNATIFSHLAWAGYLTDWRGPSEGERPAAYVVVLGDTAISHNFGCDHGIAAQTICLGAVEKGLGCCILGSVKRDGLKKDLGLDERLEILLVIAIGKPLETVVMDPVGDDGCIKYWRDDQAVHHVPKRSLDDVIVS